MKTWQKINRSKKEINIDNENDDQLSNSFQTIGKQRCCENTTRRKLKFITSDRHRDPRQRDGEIKLELLCL